MAPPSSTPPPQSFPETSPGGGGRGKGWRREEGKVLEDCGGLAGMGAGSNGGSTGSNSRARVLAQQREIEVRVAKNSPADMCFAFWVRTGFVQAK